MLLMSTNMRGHSLESECVHSRGIDRPLRLSWSGPGDACLSSAFVPFHPFDVGSDQLKRSLTITSGLVMGVYCD